MAGPIGTSRIAASAPGMWTGRMHRAESTATRAIYWTRAPRSGSSAGLSSGRAEGPDRHHQDQQWPVLGEGPGGGDGRDRQPSLRPVQAVEGPRAVELPDRQSG